METYYFTFQLVHPFHRRYMKIVASSYTSARDIMMRIFGSNWAFQYDTKEWVKGGKSQAVEYGYTLIDTVYESLLEWD